MYFYVARTQKLGFHQTSTNKIKGFHSVEMLINLIPLAFAEVCRLLKIQEDELMFDNLIMKQMKIMI